MTQCMCWSGAEVPKMQEKCRNIEKLIKCNPNPNPTNPNPNPTNPNPINPNPNPPNPNPNPNPTKCVLPGAYGETMSIMFVDGASAPSTNIMDMVSPCSIHF